ncbi:MAG: hypothetical protein RL754_300 [Bacteroidota bacterium]|jgi:hypothetical protein
MNNPKQLFGFLVFLGLSVFGLSLLTPKTAFEIGPFELSYYTPKELVGPLWRAEAAPILDTIAVDFIDSTEVTTVVEEEKVVLDTLIQVRQATDFANYFEALKALKQGQRSNVRIIHYGDSQLEGDRISSQLRDALQREYGGKGFGWVALDPLVAPASLEFKNALGLQRKTAFGRRDTAIKDSRYGHLASFTALEHEQGLYVGQISFQRRNWGYTRAKNFTKLRIDMEGRAEKSVLVISGDTVYSLLNVPGGSSVHSLNFPAENEFTLRIESKDSVRVFGLSFESTSGLWVDNVAMRGASGMMFTKLDENQFQRTLRREQYSLIILQFGGNAVPYLRDAAHARQFARSAGRQVDAIQRLYPEAAILYIGPSDMARKNGLVMESYPLIVNLKTSLRKEMLRRGCGYWDLYDVMGGEGSMVRWVDMEPAFAVKDYIHFTPYGAKWVGEALETALKELGTRYEKELIQHRAAQARKQDSITRLNQATGADSNAR